MSSWKMLIMLFVWQEADFWLLIAWGWGWGQGRRWGLQRVLRRERGQADGEAKAWG